MKNKDNKNKKLSKSAKFLQKLQQHNNKSTKHACQTHKCQKERERMNQNK